jgi:hypothetical protein
MAELYVERLAAARERMLQDRRHLAAELAKPYEGGKTEEFELADRFRAIQATVEAIDRAIEDERFIAARGKPRVMLMSIAAPSD